MTAPTARAAAEAANPRPNERGGAESLRFPTARTWVDVAVLVVLVVLGIVGFAPSFGGTGFLVAGLGGLLLGLVTALITSMFRLSIIVTVLAAVIGYFIIGPGVAVPTLAAFGVLPSLASLASLAIGSVYGWADIVTLSTPVGAPAYIAVVPYCAAWLVTLISVSLALRWLSVRPRAAWRFAVVLTGPVALYLAGILVGTDEPYQAGIRGIVFAVLALVWLGWRRPTAAIAQAGAARLRNRKLVGTAVIVTGAILVGGAGAVVIAPPHDQRFVLREEIEPPFDPLDYPSPLSGFRHYTKQVTDEVLFTVEGLEPGDQVRLATLDSFTGKLWNVTGPETSATGSGSFALVGRALPEPTFITGVDRRDVTFTIEAYSDVWLPSVGYPTDLEFVGGDAAVASDDLRYNPTTGTAVLTSGLSAGDRYTLDAEVQEVLSPTELADAEIASVELPPVAAAPDIATVRAQEYAATSTTPIGQLESMRIALVDNGFLSRGRASDSVPSRAGHGADRITELFERSQMVGDEEQYASAYALMARSLGYPARLVMGFAPEITTTGQVVEVTGDDVSVWVEVAFADIGWVAFNPTPDETDIPQDQVPQPQSEPQPQVRQPPRADNDDEDLLSPVELEESEEDENPFDFVVPGWVWVLAASILIPAAVVFIPMLVIGALKARRARRRREASAGHDRVAGAWEELTDRYSELGFEVPPKLTRLRVAERLETQLGQNPPRLRGLAATTDEAVFSGADVDEVRSETIWTEAMAAVELAKAGATRTSRLLSRYRVRSARDWAARVVSASQRQGSSQ